MDCAIYHVFQSPRKNIAWDTVGKKICCLSGTVAVWGLVHCIEIGIVHGIHYINQCYHTLDTYHTLLIDSIVLHTLVIQFSLFVEKDHQHLTRYAYRLELGAYSRASKECRAVAGVSVEVPRVWKHGFSRLYGPEAVVMSPDPRLLEWSKELYTSC